jgi:rhodanese-related sulfurtransferase
MTVKCRRPYKDTILFRKGKIAMDDRFFMVRMIPILSLILCFALSPAPAFPSKGCLPELLISTDSIVPDRELKKDLLLVDIRPPAAFAKLRIPGSLNVPIFAIKAKTFLKKYELVLVDDGYRYAQIEEECRYLRRAGFRLRILDGGLATWSRKGGALEGDEFARKALNRLSPLNFFSEKDYGNWIVLDTSEGERPESARLFSRFFSMPYTGDSMGFAAWYEEFLKIGLTDNKYKGVD